MECLEFRRAAGADPTHLNADARAHRDACPRCCEYLRQTRVLDERVLAALLPAIDRRRWFALAASIVAGVAVGSLLWVAGPREPLAHEVVEHVSHEPDAMITVNPAGSSHVEEVLERGRIRLRPGIGTVSYASTCLFRGEKVPHLVVQTGLGPATVMVLRNEKVAAPVRFDEQGYSGTIMPAGPGSIAVIGTAHANLEPVTERVLEAVEWSRD